LFEEKRGLKEELGGTAWQLNDNQRRRLAAKAKRLGRKVLDNIATIVSPNTLMRWHWKLIALKWTHQTRRVGRPRLMKVIKALIVRMGN
jgi:hypothetical protein